MPKKKRVLGWHRNGQRVVKERGRTFQTQDGLWWVGSYLKEKPQCSGR